MDRETFDKLIELNTKSTGDILVIDPEKMSIIFFIHTFC